jgi:hypothetical protein
MSRLFPNVQSTLDLNGPVLSFTTQPVGTSCSVASGIATFTGIATATFPSGQTSRSGNTGSISYQWYKGSSALTDGTNITGSGTTTLTLSGLTSPTDNNTTVFLRADYIPSAYGIGSSTANAINEPLDSNSAKVTVLPTISITTQPQDTTVVEDIATTFSVEASSSDSSTSFTYQWYLNGSALSDSSLVSGSKTKTLTITREDPALDKVYCAVSHSTAQPGIVTTTEAKLDVASARTFIQWELIGDGTRQEKGSRDLATAGQFSARARAGVGARIIQMFSPEKDIDVKITLGGAAGYSRNGNRGGEGGISVFKMTMKKNLEYTVKLGIHSNLGGGPRGGNNGGGGLGVIYEKARVIAVCGGGGGAGTGGRGGDGGGCNVRGERGQNGANGGAFIGVDALPVNGMTQAGRTGPSDFDNGSSGSGRLSGCTIGKYWREQGKSPCEDVGTGIAFRSADGGTLSDTTSTTTGGIIRGYKVGQGHRNNGGAGSGNGGGGGAGARGGQGTSSNGGGGGASGYYSSQVELLSSSTLPNGTQLGGNDDVAFICVEAYSANADQEPCIPPKSNQVAAERTVTWSVSRNAGDSNTVTFSRQSGNGPSNITFGPNGGNITTQISKGAVYTRTSSSASGGRGLSFRLSGNILQLDDNFDRDFNDLQITPSVGRFTSDSRWEANW